MRELNEIKGIGPRTIKLLNKLGINNSNDLVHYYPFRYDDIKRSDIDSLEQDDRTYAITNEMLLSWNSNYYKNDLGMKTGFTTPAGYCLIAYAEKNDLELISVVLNSSTSDNRYLETKMLLDYGFDNFSFKKFASKGDVIQTISVKGATRKTKKLNLLLENDLYITIDNSLDLSNFQPDIQIEKKIKAPIEKGKVLGSLSYTLNGLTYSSYLIAESNVKSSHLLLKFIIFFIILFIILALLKLRKNKLKNKRIRMMKKL